MPASKRGISQRQTPVDEGLTDVLEGIDRLENDASLTAVYQAYRNRSKTLRDRRAMLNVATLADGTRIRLINIRPKYLIGTEGSIVRRHSATKFVVDLDGQGQSVVPATCVEPV
jgi:hypothetical protein